MPIIYTYKCTIFPIPLVFVTAFSEIPNRFISESASIVVSEVLAMMDIACQKYNADLVSAEPNERTHNLSFNYEKNAVAIYTTIKFRNLQDMNCFIEKEIKK